MLWCELLPAREFDMLNIEVKYLSSVDVINH